jgi:hypothetical protein
MALACGLKMDSKRPPGLAPPLDCIGVALGLCVFLCDALGLLVMLAFDDTDRLAVHQQHIVGGASIRGALTYGDTGFAASFNCAMS